MNPETITALADPIGLVVGFLLTIMVLSYILGDNPLFRLAVYIFIGVASGYAAVLAFYNVIYFQVIRPLLENPAGNLALAVPVLILFLWLLTKASPRLARLGNPLLAYLVGVGAAVALSGAVMGTILPQVGATVNPFDLSLAAQTQSQSGQAPGLVRYILGPLFILLGTVVTLAYFHFGVRPKGEGLPPQRPPLVENVIVPLGQIFIAITFGALFGGVYAAALSALVNRVGFLWEVILRFVPIG